MVIDPRELTWRQNPQAVLQGEIDRDVSCVSCGYNLRGLRAAATCPECGLSAGRSLRPDAAYAEPAWVHRLIWGCNVLIVALPLSLALVLLKVPGVVFVMVWIWLPLIAIGWTLLTVREPGTNRHDKPFLRYASRWSVLLDAISIPLVVHVPELRWMILPMTIVGVAAMLTCPFHFRNLALRFNRDDLASQAFWLLIPSAMLIAGSFCVSAMITRTPSYGGDLVLAYLFGCFYYLTRITVTVWAIFLLTRLRHSLIHIVRA